MGDTLNTATRMESSRELGKINISKEIYEIINDEFDCSFRGNIDTKGKGALEMHFVEGQKHQ